MSAFVSRARVAALARHRPADDPELAMARSEHRAATLEDRLRADLPSLTLEQRARLARILVGPPAPRTDR